MASVFTTIEGLRDAEIYFRTFPEKAAQAAQLAINDTLRRAGMKLIQQEMYSQVNFPKGYLQGDRLQVSQFATQRNLEGAILARKRATSLARFVAPGTPIGSKAQTGLTVRVGSGGGTRLRAAWLVRLKAGKSLTEDKYNVGLAVRVKPGDRIGSKHSEHKSWLIPGRVALLYGPSVDQVFRSVSEDVAQPILDLVSEEFFRQLNRLT